MKIELTKEDYNAFMLFKALTNENIEKTINTTSARQRRLKGTGTVYKLSGKRTRPWVARICIGKNAKGSCVHENLGYFETENEAKSALESYALYGKPQEYRITFEELWDHVEKEQIRKKSRSTRQNYEAAYNQFSAISYKPINQITLHDLQPIFDREMQKGSGISKLSNMKTVCKKIFQYAIKYDYTDKDYTQYITIESTSINKIVHRPFNYEEIKTLLELDTAQARLVLIFIYTGMRPKELMEVKKENVHLADGYMIGGLKTVNGRNRVIPIHNFIKPFIQELLNNDGDSLLPQYTAKKGVDQYRSTLFNPLMDQLNMMHYPYDTRHTFATLCEENGLNDYLVKKIMGHSCKDLTKDVYTHASIERLVNEINKLPVFLKGGENHE